MKTPEARNHELGRKRGCQQAWPQVEQSASNSTREHQRDLEAYKRSGTVVLHKLMADIDELKNIHAKEIDELERKHAQEIDVLKANHTKDNDNQDFRALVDTVETDSRSHRLSRPSRSWTSSKAQHLSTNTTAFGTVILARAI
jgi:hypothetical protein